MYKYKLFSIQNICYEVCLVSNIVYLSIKLVFLIYFPKFKRLLKKLFRPTDFYKSRSIICTELLYVINFRSMKTLLSLLICQHFLD